ncbi:MAG TPA: helix-turn-helix domain-containing protein [Streptosporangiaceae bacterium]
MSQAGGIMGHSEDDLAVDRAAARACGRAGVPLPRQAAAVVGEVTSELAGQADGIALAMVRACAAEIPAYRQLADQALRTDVRAVCAALVRCWLAVVAADRPPPAELLRPMAEGARRGAAQGIDLQSMLRAYRVGIRVMWSEVTATPAWRGRVPDTALTQAATWTLDLADQVCTAAAAAYADELASAERGPEDGRSALLNLILAGQGPEHTTAPAELRRPHCVVVARVDPDLPLAHLEDTGQALRQQADAGLWTIRYGDVVAAIPLPVPAGRDALRQRLADLIPAGTIAAAGLGGRSEDVAETRSSYREAAAALHLGSRLGPGHPAVYDYRELAPLIALMSQPGQASRFTATALEPLDELASRSWVLPTLEAYLARQGHLKEMAAALDVHPSTIKYRLRELRPYIQASLSDGDRAATTLLALRIHRLLAPESSAEPATGSRRRPGSAAYCRLGAL